jgi:endonuclease/exonuclease/phosphatase family metal-dependent hydrolase
MLCWGFNRQGQLGDGTLTNHVEPEPVAGGNVWTQVTTGDGFTCGTADDGRLWCWGDNRYGQIGGKPTLWPRPTPTLVTALDSPVHLVSSGWMHTCVIPVGGTVTCWGNDGAGQLGDGGTATAKPLEPARQVDLPRSDLPAIRFLRRASPAQIAATGVASRPAAHARTPATRRAADVSPFTIMTMNELGSQHTAPSGDEPQMPPGRIRAEWAGTYYRLKNASLIGTQETQPDQIVALDDATRHRYAFYPGNSTGYAGAPQSVMWRRADWRLVWHSSISIPFQRGWRPQPIVELQQRATGANVYWVNVHFSPRGQQADRNKAMRILLAAMHRLRKDHLPILLTGDFNEKAAAFCTITGKTPMVAATGGSNKGGRCRMPSPAKLDWIFGSGGTFGNALMDHSAQVRRMTDHSVLSALFSTG